MTTLEPTRYHRHSRLAAATGIGILLAVTGTVAQPGQTSTGPLSQAPAFKYYVWGQVRSPGAYNLSANADILELLSAGGGPTEQADLGRVVLVRAVTQEREKINLRRMLESGDVIPLSPGDVVIVPRLLWYSIRDQLTVVTAVAILTNLVLTIIYGSRQ